MQVCAGAELKKVIYTLSTMRCRVTSMLPDMFTGHLQHVCFQGRGAFSWTWTRRRGPRPSGAPRAAQPSSAWSWNASSSPCAHRYPQAMLTALCSIEPLHAHIGICDLKDAGQSMQ